MEEAATFERSARLVVKRASQISLRFSVMELFWNHERVAQIRAGETAEIKLIPGEGDFQVRMRSAITGNSFFTRPLRLKLIQGKTTFVRMKADPNLYGWPAVNCWVDTNTVPRKVGWM